MSPSNLSTLDVLILQFLIRFQMARGHQIFEWVGGGKTASTVSSHLRRLSELGLIRSVAASVDLRGPDGKIKEGCLVYVWQPTTKAALRVGPWEAAGTGGGMVELPVRKMSKLTSHHVLGVVDLGVWYRKSGFEICSEREILSLERTSELRPFRVTQEWWSVPVAGRKVPHPPDLGAVGPDGTKWAVELERAVKTVADYQEVIKAFQDAHQNQIWHVLSERTSKRLMAACRHLGVQWGRSPAPGVIISRDGTMRFQGWVPGRAGLSGPTSWRGQYPRQAPAGLPTLEVLPDRTLEWRLRTPINVHKPGIGGQFY